MMTVVFDAGCCASENKQKKTQICCSLNFDPERVQTIEFNLSELRLKRCSLDVQSLMSLSAVEMTCKHFNNLKETLKLKFFASDITDGKAVEKLCNCSL